MFSADKEIHQSEVYSDPSEQHNLVKRGKFRVYGVPNLGCLSHNILLLILRWFKEKGLPNILLFSVSDKEPSEESFYTDPKTRPRIRKLPFHF